MCESAHELGDKKLNITTTMHKLFLLEDMSALSQNNEVRTGEPALEMGRTERTIEASKQNLRSTALNSLTGPAWSASLILGRRPGECAYPPANMDHSNLFTQHLSAPLDILVQIQKAVPPEATAHGHPWQPEKP